MENITFTDFKYLADDAGRTNAYILRYDTMVLVAN